MQKISIYVSDEAYRRIKLIAKTQNKTQSEVIREALDEGLKILQSF